MAERQGTVHLAFRLHRLDPSHRGLGYCSWKQDTKERYWGQQFCPIMERDSFGPTDQTDQTGQIGLPSKRALSIQQKFRFEISEISRAQWSCAFRLHRPHPSHRAFGYSCKQDATERHCRRQFCQMERDISVRPTEMTRPVKLDHLQSWFRLFRSDQTEMVRSIWCTNRNFRTFGLNGKRPWSRKFRSDQTEIVRSIWCTNRNFRHFDSWKAPQGKPGNSGEI